MMHKGLYWKRDKDHNAFFTEIGGMLLFIVFIKYPNSTRYIGYFHSATGNTIFTKERKSFEAVEIDILEKIICMVEDYKNAIDLVEKDLSKFGIGDYSTCLGL